MKRRQWHSDDGECDNARPPLGGGTKGGAAVGGGGGGCSSRSSPVRCKGCGCRKLRKHLQNHVDIEDPTKRIKPDDPRVAFHDGAPEFFNRQRALR